MIGAPGEPGAATLRAAKPSEADAVQAVWEESALLDDPAGWPGGGWSVAGWATDSRVLMVDGRLVGVVAVRDEPAPDGAMPGRVALAGAARQPRLAEPLVDSAVDLVREARGTRVRLFMGSRAEWASATARARGFQQVRTIAHMLLPADAATPTAAIPAGLRIRSIRRAEDALVLAALNRAWSGTWNFVSIPLEMLRDDLHGQRQGMLLAVDESDRIVGTCHAVYAPSQRNPDGNSRAWISNLTVDPEHRQRGVARAMLAAGIAHLRARGATSVTLGVDADNPAPFGLYRSVGFEVASSIEAWDLALGA